MALSILELHSSAEIGLFELSISLPEEGKIFNKMLSPTHVMIGHIGDKYNENFVEKNGKKIEYLNFINFQDGSREIGKPLSLFLKKG